jgi:hypothetical protein
VKIKATLALAILLAISGAFFTLDDRHASAQEFKALKKVVKIDIINAEIRGIRQDVRDCKTWYGPDFMSATIEQQDKCLDYADDLKDKEAERDSVREAK